MNQAHSIVKLRKAHRMTQKQLAYKAWISTGYLSDIEHGRAKARMKTFAIIASILNVSLMDLIEK